METPRATRRTALFGCSALVMAAVATGACAQAAPDEGSTLTEIVVTAQKREQSIQDVPISISAVGQDVLQANRITNVGELAAISPGLTARPSAGGSNIPSFSMRGVTSYGVVPGSDKSVSLYIDGVYIGSATGSIFDLPDVERIEVLRGPQGTLFGRNATAGAVSVITRNPTGQFGLRQELTYGNYDQVRSRTRIDFPQMGPFSGSVNYVHDERRGEVRNLGAGAVWDRTGSDRSSEGVQVSPKWLGSKSSDLWFAAVRFEPRDDFNVTYKFDYAVEHNTPEAESPVYADPSKLGPLVGPLFATLLTTQPTPVVFNTAAKRPKEVNNSWDTAGYQKVFGHNITANWRLSDQISLKNILAYRESFNYGNSAIDGLSALTFTQQAVQPLAVLTAATLNLPTSLTPLIAQALQPYVGQPFAIVASQSQSQAKQWSDEIQLNYDSKYLTLTTGALYFHLATVAGAAPGLTGTLSFTPLLNGVIPTGSATSYNYASSYAAYAQAEFHLTSQLDLVGGYRLTKDDKSGTYYSPTGPISFTYTKTKPSYLMSLNYKPMRDMLIYGKYSSAFVSGGTVGPAAFQPETAHSWEAGFKADLLDRRLRTNLAVWTVKYSDLQSAQGGSNVGFPEFSTVVIDQGDAKAHGFELEVTALPLRGLTLNGGLGYTHVTFSNINPILFQGPEYLPTLQPKWTGTMAAEYQTQPVWNDALVKFRVDANWRDSQRTFSYDPVGVPGSILSSPSSWIVNTRVALQHIRMPHGDAEVALWGRNITNNKTTQFPLSFNQFIFSSSFTRAPTYGIDFNYEY